MTAHPGTIVVVDEETRSERKLRASDVPESVAFIEGKPVVRVVTRKRGNERELLSFGVDGTLLQTAITR